MRRKRKKLAQVARILARGQLHIQGSQDEPEQVFDDALAAFGLSASADDTDDDHQDKCYLWPCNVPAFNLWQRLQTQWRVGGMGSATGLDYASVSLYLRDVAGIKRKEMPELFNAIQAMERATLEEWAAKRD